MLSCTNPLSGQTKDTNVTAYRTQAGEGIVVLSLRTNLYFSGHTGGIPFYPRRRHSESSVWASDSSANRVIDDLVRFLRREQLWQE